MSVEVETLQKKYDSLILIDQQLVKERQQSEQHIIEVDEQRLQLRGRAAQLQELIDEAGSDTVKELTAEG